MFDTFGTVVDWRGTIIAEGAERARAKGTSVDWGAFADAWRAEYRPSMERVHRGELPWTHLDGLHRMSLERVASQFKLSLTTAEFDELHRVWHRCKPWPDSVPGLQLGATPKTTVTHALKRPPPTAYPRSDRKADRTSSEKQVRLFPGRQVAALGELVEVDEIAAGALGPTPRRLLDLLREDGDVSRNGDVGTLPRCRR